MAAATVRGSVREIRARDVEAPGLAAGDAGAFLAAPLETEQPPLNAKPKPSPPAPLRDLFRLPCAARDPQKPKPSPPAPLRDLFRFADGLDRILIAVGMLGALVHGCSLPVFHAHDPDTMVRLVVKYASYFLDAAAGRGG